MGLPQFEGSRDSRIETVYYTGTTTLHEGAMVYWTSAASPVDTTAFPPTKANTTALPEVHGPGTAVEVNPTVVPAKFAGVVHSSSSGVTDPGYINITVPQPGDVVTVAVAVAIDTGDGGVLTDSQQHLADGGAYAVASDEWYVLYDEDNANNPHGTSAISASVGLVEAVYTGVNR